MRAPWAGPINETQPSHSCQTAVTRLKQGHRKKRKQENSSDGSNKGQAVGQQCSACRRHEQVKSEELRLSEIIRVQVAVSMQLRTDTNGLD